jgi:GNAT superfamily N-acetyltransferase
MLSDRALLRAHVEALFTQDSTGRLVAVNEPGGKAAPRFFLGRTPQGSESWYRNDLPEEAVASLRAACAVIPPGMELKESGTLAAPFLALLEQTDPVQEIWSGPAFRFPDRLEVSSSIVPITAANADILRPQLAAWYQDVTEGRTLYGAVVKGEAVSVCASVRQTVVAEEAGVETAPDFRGQGYAAPAVLAWAAAVRHAGRLPLYSTSWNNRASQALARRLGLVQFASDLHIT